MGLLQLTRGGGPLNAYLVRSFMKDDLFAGNPALLEVIRSGETPGQRERLLQHIMGEALMSQHF